MTIANGVRDEVVAQLRKKGIAVVAVSTTEEAYEVPTVTVQRDDGSSVVFEVHVRLDPLHVDLKEVPKMTDGWWWAQCRWNGDFEVVHIKQNQLSDGFRVDISGTEEPYDGTKLLREYELISRIPEPPQPA